MTRARISLDHVGHLNASIDAHATTRRFERPKVGKKHTEEFLNDLTSMPTSQDSTHVPLYSMSKAAACRYMTASLTSGAN